jgi:hypothetical protein
MNVRHVGAGIATVAVSFLLTGCFLAKGLFERERIWDPAWFGRYEGDGGTYVVLPDDPTKRTYLVGSFESGSTSVDSYRSALYPGWGDTLIVGNIALGKNETRAAYTLLWPTGPNRFASDWPSCSAEFAGRHHLPRESDACTLSSLEIARTALKAYEDEKAALKSEHQGNIEPQALERRRDHPLSTIGIVARAGVVSDGEGVHGALTLLDVPPTSPAGLAGLKRGDIIFAIGNARPAIGEELLLRIAVAQPNSNIEVSYFDGKTKEKRQVAVRTAPLE